MKTQAFNLNVKFKMFLAVEFSLVFQQVVQVVVEMLHSLGRTPRGGCVGSRMLSDTCWTQGNTQITPHQYVMISPRCALAALLQRAFVCFALQTNPRSVHATRDELLRLCSACHRGLTDGWDDRSDVQRHEGLRSYPEAAIGAGRRCEQA